MIIRMAIQTGYGGVRHVAVSLPRIDFLLADQPAKYAESLPGVQPITAPAGRNRGINRRQK